MFQQIFNRVYYGHDLNRQESLQIIQSMMEGALTPVQTAGFLTALHIKGETVEEITAFAEVMREKSLGMKLTGDLVDTCGTGGDHKNVFNISTATAIALGAAGLKVAKHGNRAVSSSAGSADVLSQLGVNIHLDFDQVRDCIESVGLGFLFALNFHPAMKFVAPVRKELGVRTIFNILGPLANPFGANCQIIGVFDNALCLPLASSLHNLGLKNAMVIHSDDGLDEISIFAKTHGFFFQDNGSITEISIDPELYAMHYQPEDIAAIKVANIEEAETLLLEAISGRHTIASDIMAINAAAVLWLLGHCQDIGEGLQTIRNLIKTGAISDYLERFILQTQKYVRPMGI